MMLEWDRTNEKSSISLDNKKGITDWNTLNEIERRYSYIRLPELEKIDNNKKIVFNKEYFLSIHKFIFQDIYPWAGTIREVDLYKGNSAFAPAHFLDRSLDTFFKNLQRDNFLQGFTTEEIAELSSYYLLELNFIHPFREGNGRTKRYFMTQLVKNAGYDLGLERIDADKLVMADILAFEDTESDIKANPSYFKFLLNSAVKPLDEQNIKKTKNEPSLANLNRFLWVYDRFSENAYFRAYNSISEAENKLSEQLSTDVGKERVKRYLDRIMAKEKAYQDGTAEYRKNIIKEAVQYKKSIDEEQIKTKKPIEKTKLQIEVERKDLSLANKLDLFAPYVVRHSNPSENQFPYKSYKNTQEMLEDKQGRSDIDLLLQRVIKNENNPDYVKVAKHLRLELLNPVAQKGSMASYLHQIQSSPIQTPKTEKTVKKQKEIK